MSTRLERLVYALEGASSMQFARGTLAGTFECLGFNTIYYRDVRLMRGLMFDTIFQLSVDEKLRATKIVAETLPRVTQLRRQRGLMGAHMMSDLYDVLMHDPEYVRLRNLVIPENRPNDVLILPLERNPEHGTLYAGGYADDPIFNQVIQHRDQLHAAARQFHKKMREFAIPGASRLTMPEIRALHWATQGKTQWETSRIEHVSESAIAKRLTNAMSKLHATNKPHLVALAVQMGLDQKEVLIAI